MGGVASILDSCGCGEDDPISYMEREYQQRKMINGPGIRTSRRQRPDMLTSALYTAMADLRLNKEKKLDKSDFDKDDSENEYLDNLREGGYQRRGSGDSVASFMTDVRRMEVAVSISIVLLKFFLSGSNG